MNRGVLLLALLGGHAVAAMRGSSAVPLDYRFGYERPADGAPVLHVMLSTTGDASGRTAFVVPSSWAGQDSLRNAIAGDAGTQPN